MGVEVTEENKSGLDSFSENNMFDTEKFINQEEEDRDLDLLNYDGVEKPAVQEEEEEEQQEETEDFNFEGLSEEEKIDLEVFNKKFSKDFKTEQELKDFLDGKETKEETVKDEDILEKAESQLAVLEPVLLLSNEALMRKEFEVQAVQNKKDINDEDVKIEIEEQVQDLIDKGVLNIQADYLRNKLKAIVEDSKKTKDSIVQKRESEKKEQEKTEKEQIQKELIAFHNLKNFYGVKLDKETVARAYKKISSGEFIKNLTSDKKAMSELALMAEVKEIIFKKSSGLTYNDGIKAILDEFKATPKENTVAKAQSRGSAASAGGQDALINSILSDKVVEKEDK